MVTTSQYPLVIEREGDGSEVTPVELTSLVSIAAVQRVHYRLSSRNVAEDSLTPAVIEDIASSRSNFIRSSYIHLPYDGYMIRGLAQLVTMGPFDTLSIPRPHKEGATYIILVSYDLEELWLSELKSILQARHGHLAVFGLIPESVLRKLSEGPPNVRCSYFPSVYL